MRLGLDTLFRGSFTGEEVRSVSHSPPGLPGTPGTLLAVLHASEAALLSAPDKCIADFQLESLNYAFDSKLFGSETRF